MRGVGFGVPVLVSGVKPSEYSSADRSKADTLGHESNHTLLNLTGLGRTAARNAALVVMPCDGVLL
jgi:hypothetical protein